MYRIFSEASLRLRKMRVIIFLLLFALPAAVPAQTVPSTCNTYPRVSAEAAALYWKPYGSETVIGTLRTQASPDELSDANIKLILLEPEYNWGFRVGGAYSVCCERIALGFEYNHLIDENTFEITNTNPLVFFISSFFPFAQQDLTFRANRRFFFHTFDLVAMARLYANACVHASLLGGVRYLYFRLTNRTCGRTLSGEEIEHRVVGVQRLKVGGPIFGVQGSYGLCSWMRFYATALFGGLLGRNNADAERRTTFFSPEQPPNVVTVRATQGQDFFSPLLEARAGAYTCFRICSCELVLMASYEYRAQINGRRIGLAAPDLPEGRRELVFSGLVLTALLAF